MNPKLRSFTLQSLIRNSPMRPQVWIKGGRQCSPKMSAPPAHSSHMSRQGLLKISLFSTFPPDDELLLHTPLCYAFMSQTTLSSCWTGPIT